MLKGQQGYAFSLAAAVQDAAEKTIDNYNPGGGPGGHKTEDQITSGFVQSVQNIDYYKWGVPRNFTVSADSYTANTEGDTGVDLAVLYEVDLPEFNLQTALLIQAKRQGTKHYKDYSKAKKQCGKMLRLTTDSFLFDYSDQEMCAVPAISVAGSDDSMFKNNPKYPDVFLKKSVSGLFKPFFLGYRGNEHAYAYVHQWNNSSPNFRRQRPVFPDGGQENEGNEEPPTHIISIEVTGEQLR